jgi:hypothetical protein
MLPRRILGRTDQAVVPRFELQRTASSEESLKKTQKAQ